MLNAVYLFQICKIYSHYVTSNFAIVQSVQDTHLENNRIIDEIVKSFVKIRYCTIA